MTKVSLTSVHGFPVIEHTLGEGLAGSLTTELCVEAKGLHYREVSLDSEHGCSGSLLFTHDLSTTLVEHTVDTTNRVLGTLYLDYKRKYQTIQNRT